jgi:hypothetical protein
MKTFPETDPGLHVGETVNHSRRGRVHHPLEGLRLCDTQPEVPEAEAAGTAFSRMQVDASRRFDIRHCVLLRPAA